MVAGIFFTVLRSKVTLLLITVAFAWLLLRNQSLFEPPYENHYAVCAGLLQQAQELTERNANKSDWSALQQSSREQLSPIVTELKRVCERNPVIRESTLGSATPDRMTQLIRQPLLQVARDRLPSVFAAGASGKPPEIAEVEAQLALVRKALDAIKLGGEPAQP